MTEIPAVPVEDDRSRARALADELDYFLEDDVCVLLDIEPTTAANWRARRIGPDFTSAGKVVLYPKIPFARWLGGRTKTTTA